MKNKKLTNARPASFSDRIPKADRSILKPGETLLRSKKSQHLPSSSPLLDIEVALRRCQRTGLFRK